MLAVIIVLLQLPVDEGSLGLGATLQKHTAVLHTKHSPVLHFASCAVHIIYIVKPKTHKGGWGVCDQTGTRPGCLMYRDAEGPNTGREGPHF